MLRGESILRPNRKEDGNPDGGTLLPIPSDEQMSKLFDDTVRDAFAGMPHARSDHYQAARAIYAALSADAGDRDTSVLDTDRWERAIQLATGGVEKYRGRNILMPYGYDPSMFRDGIARRVDDLIQGGRLDEQWTKSKLLDLPLMAVGDGRYTFVVGDALLVDRKGDPVEVDFQTSTAFRTSGHGLRAAAAEPTAAELAEASKAVTGRADPRKQPLKLAKK